MFNLFCKHEWEEDERFYAPPIIEALSDCKTSGDYRDLVREMMFGITTIKMRCIHCGWIEPVKILGKEVKEDEKV